MRGLYLAGVRLRRELPEHTYLRTLAPVRFLMEGKDLTFDAPVTFLVGENGTGKSTLLEGIAVACGFNPEGGSRNFAFSTRETHSPLGESLTPIRRGYPTDGFFLRAESFYNVATNIDQMDEEPGLGSRLIDSYGGVSLHKQRLIDSYGGVSLHKQSHGESFLALVQNRFGGQGLYLLDEPEAALSPSRLLTLLAELHRLVGEHSQFLIATHSPILMAYPEAQIYQLEETGIRQVSYRETEHYQLTRTFLENPERMLRYLLAGEEP